MIDTVRHSNAVPSAQIGTQPPAAALSESMHNPESGRKSKTRSVPKNKPTIKPGDARFSSGPCKKHPGWNPATFNTELLGRSHRAASVKARLKSAIDRSASLLNLPSDWKLGIVPGSDTGAFEMALWSLLGIRSVEALVWESFSSDWAKDLTKLSLPALKLHTAHYGEIPDLNVIDPSSDVVFVYNGTTSGVRVPDLNWLSPARDGLVLCDATSAAFAMPLDFTRLDVVTWSWQKVLGGEGAHGMLALSPRAVARLENGECPRPLPKLFTLANDGSLIQGIFSGATINTPSVLAVEDLHSALDWAESSGGAEGLAIRTKENFKVLNNWISDTYWVEWLPTDPATRSETSMCIRINSDEFRSLSSTGQSEVISAMAKRLEQENVAFDIKNYRSAPAGFRIWGGPTVESNDVSILTQWLDWAYHETDFAALKEVDQNG